MKKPSTIISLAAVGALTLAACGGDDDEGASGGDFCEIATQADSLDPDEDLEGARDVLRDLADAAPAEIEDEIQSFLQAFEAFASEDADAIAAIDQDAFLNDVTAVGSYLVDNCDGIDSDPFEL